MRNPLPLFAVSVLLFITGIGFVIAGARDVRRAKPPASVATSTALAPIATTRHLMAAVIDPAATAIFQSVQTNITLAGKEEIRPDTDEEWALLGAHAASLAEAGRLLMADGLAIDREGWIVMSRAMTDAAKQTLTAVNAKSPEAVFEAGASVATSCDTCHERYRRQ